MVQEIDVLRAFQAGCDKREVSFPRGFGPGLFKQAADFLRWCGKSDIDDPLGYLTYWFKTCDHTGREPKIFRLRSQKLGDLWKSWKEGEHLDDVRYAKLKARAGTRSQQHVKALRILTRGHEAAKAPYYQRQQPELCLVEIEYTGGFHPESRYCGHCTAAVRCAAKLYQQHGFDVVSLRAGRLNDLPADIAAAAVS